MNKMKNGPALSQGESQLTNSPQKTTDSYLDRHLYRKNFEFNRLKEIQEQRKAQQQNEMVQISKDLLH